jgi:ribosome-binding factor A
MPQEYSRTLRIGEQIRRELADQIRKLKDPRIGMVTITDVEVSKDLSHAKIFYTVFGEEQEIKDTQTGLQNASGFLRRELGRVLKVRITPNLHFLYDDTQLRGNKIDQLIDQALASDRLHHPDQDDQD